MPRCGCVDDICNCSIFGGRGVSLSGTGNEGNPLTLDVSTVAYFQREPGEGTEIAVTGTGTPTDPYIIEADLAYTGSVPVHSTYSVPGSTSTWTKPTGVSLILVTLIGGGQGGQGGGDWLGVGGAVGGLGGAGGGLTQRYIYLASTVTHATVTVGTGGVGGTGAALPYGLPQLSGSFGSHTTLTLHTATTTLHTFMGGGGGTATNHRGYGTQNGQQPPAAYAVPVAIPPNNAGGAGGGGEGIGGGPRMGGAHNLYAGTVLDSTKRPRGGNGGSGGGIIGGSGRNGDNGYLYGGGGGGGGGATSMNPYAGHGGNGAAGIAVITVL